MVQLLLNLGADPNVEDGVSHYAALMMAINNHVELVNAVYGVSVARSNRHPTGS
jgi:hypothetical protein